MKLKINLTVILIILLLISISSVYFLSSDKPSSITKKIEKVKKIIKIIDVEDVALKLNELTKNEEQIIIPSELYHSFIPHTKNSNLNKTQFIFEDEDEKWSSLLDFPGKNASWAILQNPKEKNSIYNLLKTQQGNNFSKYYTLEFKGKNAEIYKLKDKKDIPITTHKDKLLWRYDRFIIKGINSYNLTYKSRPEIEKTFQKLSEIGVNTIRFWAFKDGDKDGLQTSAGIMNEKKLQNLDFVMSMANKYQIHLIPVLVNNWNDFGGKQQYLQWSKLGHNKDLFYSQAKIKQLFKNYIAHIVPRNNSITNIHYSDDLSILAWELMNEPRISAGKENFLTEWTKEMSDYIKQKDSTHLIYTGSEAETGKNSTGTALGLCSIDSIDICSTHIYLYDKQTPLYQNTKQLSKFIINQKEFAKNNNKPLLIGEIGVSEKHKPFGKPPIEAIKDIVKIILDNDLDGYLIWDWDPLYYYDPFSFGLNMERNYNIKKLEEILSNK